MKINFEKIQKFIKEKELNKTKVLLQFVVFNPPSYFFEETIEFDKQASFERPPA